MGVAERAACRLPVRPDGRHPVAVAQGAHAAPGTRAWCSRNRPGQPPGVRYVAGDDEVTVPPPNDKVGYSADSKDSKTWWRLGPGDEELLAQTLQVHFVEIPPGKANKGHGHQNEAVFCILEGSGYEIHDDQRYDRKPTGVRAWRAGCGSPSEAEHRPVEVAHVADPDHRQ